MGTTRRLELLRGHLAAQQGANGPSVRLAECSAGSHGDGQARINCGGDHARPFELWTVGLKLQTKQRTIFESDVTNYTQLTGYAAENLFGDVEYLKNVAGHQRRLAPGLLTASIADALIVGSGILEGYAVALVKITDMVAKAPVYAGDSIRVLVDVVEAVPSRSKPDRGVVTTRQSVVNQEGRVVLEYTVSRMLRRASPAS